MQIKRLPLYNPAPNFYNPPCTGVLSAFAVAEIKPAELRMKFQPDPDNTGGGRYA